MTIRSLLAATFLSGLSAALLSQSPLTIGSVNGVVSPESLGSQNAVTELGDVTGDGIPDFAAGAPNWPLPHPTVVGATIAQVGKARIYSGASLTQLFEVTGTANLQALGRSVANVLDLNGDGRDEVAIGAPMFGPPIPGGTPPPSQVQVWSAATGTLYFTINPAGFTSTNFGMSIAGIGDVGSSISGIYSAFGDGIPDILVGANLGNSAAVYSGQNGALLYILNASTINPPLPAPPLLLGGDDFGGTVAGRADLNADAIPDFLVCARNSQLGGTAVVGASTFGSGAVFVLSGNGGAVLQVIVGGPGDQLGQGAAFIDDVDQDGVVDFALGSTRSDVGGTDTGSVQMYSGATRNLLWISHGLVAGDFFGFAVSRAGDFNGDGIDEVLVGSPSTDVGATNTGSITLLDGATGARFESLHGLVSGDALGRGISYLGDQDGDGYAEVLAGAPAADVGGTSTGTVSLVSFGPHLGFCAAGNVPNGISGTFDVLEINGIGGSSPRRVDVGIGQPFQISFTQPTAWTTAAPTYLFLHIGVPTATDSAVIPGLGTLCFLPPILNPGDPSLVLFSNSFVATDPAALLPSMPPGPFTLPFAAGLPGAADVALTGVAAQGAQFFALNTVLLRVR